MALMDETRIPLLAGSEEDESLQEELQDNVQVEFTLMSPPREPSGEHASSVSGAVKVRQKHYSGSEMIVAVFVVAFDTKKGVCAY